MTVVAQTYGTGGLVSARTARTVSRRLADVQVSAAVDLARIEAAVRRRETVTEGITAIAGQALQHVGMVAQVEQTLALAAQHASGRLAAVADAHALAMTAAVVNAARALERLA